MKRLRESSEIIADIVTLIGSGGEGAEKSVLKDNKLYIATRFVSEYGLFADARTDADSYPGVQEYLDNRSALEKEGVEFPAVTQLLKQNGVDVGVLSTKTLQTLNNAGIEYLQTVYNGNPRFDK